MDTLYKPYKKVRTWLKVRDLWDARILILTGFAFMAMSVFWSGAQIVQQNYELSQKAEAIRQQNEVLELENQNKELRNRFFATDEYAELTARRVKGVAAKGEKMYIVPKEEALAVLIEQEEPIIKEEELPEKPQYQQNLEAWLDIYFGN